MRTSTVWNEQGTPPATQPEKNNDVVAAWIRRSKQTSTSTLADVLDGMGHVGALSSSVQRLGQSQAIFAGHAYCVSWRIVRKTASIVEPQPSTWDQVSKFLVPELEDGVGRVYLAGAGPLVTEAALAGGMSATYFAELGFEGIVLGGAIRDPATLAALNIPVAATGYVPSDTQGAYRVSETGGSCMIDHHVINTGDWVVSDEAGTVVIPQPIIEEVLTRAEALEEIEANMLRQIRQGVRLPELVAQAKRI